MQRIGVLGAGKLAKFHLKCISEIDDFELAGLYAPDTQAASVLAGELNIKLFNSVDELIEATEVVDIVTPAIRHFDCAERALKKSRHVFLDKPLFATVEQARKLMDLAEEADVKVQLGHVERFNPAFIAARGYIDAPIFIEVERYTHYNPNTAEIPVVMDLMMHDLDIILSIVNSPVKKVWAHGLPVVSPTPDMANVRLEFDNGCVANLNASRVSLKRARKAEFYQRNAYVAIDFLNKKTEIIEYREPNGYLSESSLILENKKFNSKKELKLIKPEIKPVNAIKTELLAFANSIENNSFSPVPISDGVNALSLSHQIMEQINYKI